MHQPRLRRLFCFYLSFAFVLSACKRESGPTMDSPVPPKDAVATFELEPGFKIELIAAEPLVADPVAMEIDENGNLYVVENHGYPLDKSKSSKVKLLCDTNGDGQMDVSTRICRYPANAHRRIALEEGHPGD